MYPIKQNKCCILKDKKKEEKIFFDKKEERKGNLFIALKGPFKNKSIKV